MKRIFLILSICLLSLGAMSQNKANEVIARYYKISGLDKLDSKSVSMMVDLSVSGPQGDVPIKMISAPVQKYRIESFMAGMKVLMVADGTDAWVQIPGQGVHKLPKETFEQIASQGDVLNSMMMDNSIFNFVYDSEKDDQYILKATVKEGANSKGVKGIILFFDKATGFNTKTIATIETNGQTMKVTSKASKFKVFGTITFPTVITVEIEGQPEATSTVNVKGLVLDYPTAAWMFAEPK